MLADDGVLFGATVPSDCLEDSFLGRILNARYNRMGVFGNAEDTLPGLRAELEQRVTQVDGQVVGCVGVFEARGPRVSSGRAGG